MFVIFLVFLFLAGCSSPEVEDPIGIDTPYSLSQSFIRIKSSALLPDETDNICLVVKGSNGVILSNDSLNVDFTVSDISVASLSSVNYETSTGFYCATITALNTGTVTISATVNGELVTNTASITVKEVLDKPTIIPTSSYYDDDTLVWVRMDTADANASIYYTTDGTEPSKTNGTLYTNEFSITTPKTIKAISYSDSVQYEPSDVASVELSSDVNINVTEDVVKWNKTFPASGEERFRDVAFDSEGSLYVVGYGYRLVSSTSDEDWWIKKFSPDGEEDTTNWNKKINGTADGNDYAYGIAIDSNDNIYVVGITHNGSNYDWWIKKFDKDGIEDTTNWNKQIDSGNGDDRAYGIAIDKDDNVYIVGDGYKIVSGSNNRDVWIKKFDKDGVEDTTNWDKKIDFRGNVDYALRVAINNNKVYVIGSGMNVFGSSTNYDWWIKKYTTEGEEDTVNWNKKINIGVNDYVQGINFDSQNNVYIIGIVSGISTGYSLAIKKFTEDGEEDTSHWNKVFNVKNYAGNDDDGRLLTIVLDKYDNVYVAGGAYRAVSYGSGWDLFLTKYDPNGVEDTHNFNMRQNVYSYDFIHKILFDSNGNLFEIGAVNGNGYDGMIKKLLIEKE